MRAQTSPASLSRALAPVLATLLLGFAAAPAPVAASPDAEAGSVECKLPPQIRSLGRNVTYLAAGRVVRIPVAECKLRGGTWSGGGPGAYAGASGKPGGPVGVTVGGDDGGAACPLQGKVAGLSRGSTLSVRSGPSTNFARLDRLVSGTPVYLCDRSGDAGWVGVVYGTGDCGLSAPITPPRAYSGACRSGWVRSDYLR